MSEEYKSSKSCFSKAALVIITNDQDDYNGNYKRFGNLITYIERKLKLIDTNLIKISFLTSHDHNELTSEIIYYKNLNNMTLLYVTTAATDLEKLLIDINNPVVENLASSNVTVYERKLFLIPDQGDSFYENFAAVSSYIKLNQGNRIKVIFESRNQLEAFRKSKEAEIVEVRSRYGEHVGEVNSAKPMELKADYFLNNNLSNSDHLVYNFASICRSYLSPTDDLTFLANKINLESFHARISHSISIVEQTLNRSSNRLQTPCIAFNGGKDCCVVLYLFFACALRLGFDLPLKVVIISMANPFDEMERFIFDELKSFYLGSSLLEYIVLDDTSKTLKERLFALKHSHPDLDYILMGTRRSDAHYFKNMGEFEPTDADWPRFTRVNPILDWTYSEIWFLIRLLKLPYCSLYDRGYTSVDHADNTHPNRHLFDSTLCIYRPAYFLSNDDHERTSRH